MAPHPDLLGRLNALEAKLNRLEAAARAPSTHTDEEMFWAEVTETFKAIQDNFTTLNARLKALEERPQLKFHGPWEAGKIYQENSLVLKDGPTWIAKKQTAAFPGGGADPDAWQLCAKRGNDGKDLR
jgi:hypothetical protein